MNTPGRRAGDARRKRDERRGAAELAFDRMLSVVFNEPAFALEVEVMREANAKAQREIGCRVNAGTEMKDPRTSQ